MKKRSSIVERSLLSLQAMFHLRRWLLPARKLLREFRNLGLLPLLFPALQVVRGRWGGGGGSRDAPGIVSWRASSPPFGSRSSERGGSASGLSSVASGRALALLASLGAGEGGVARSQRSFLPATLLGCLSPFLAAVGICGRLRRTAPACYPLVVPDLRIVEHGRIRELVHGRVVFVDRGSLSRSLSSSCSRSEVALCPCAVASRSVAVF